MGRHGIAAQLGRIAFIALLLPVAATAAQTLTLRLVEAHNRSTTTDAALSDVATTLQRNLPYSGFTHLGSGTISLPAGGNKAFAGGYSIRATGPATNCAVEIKKNGKSQLKSTVSLRGSTPLILGGFPAGNGRHLFVLKLQ